MGRNCTVCMHPAKNDIDVALETRESLREIAARYGISKTALHRHWRKHFIVKSATANGSVASHIGTSMQANLKSRTKAVAKWVLVGLGVLVLVVFASKLPGREAVP